MRVSETKIYSKRVTSFTWQIGRLTNLLYHITLYGRSIKNNLKGGLLRMAALKSQTKTPSELSNQIHFKNQEITKYAA
jgi:hypothetical protein